MLLGLSKENLKNYSCFYTMKGFFEEIQSIPINVIKQKKWIDHIAECLRIGKEIDFVTQSMLIGSCFRNSRYER